MFAFQRWWKLATNDGPANTDSTTELQPNTPPDSETNGSSDQGVSHPVAAAGESANTDSQENPHVLDEVLALAKSALQRHRAYHQDYTADLTKTERIGTKLAPTSKIFMKLRYRDLPPHANCRGVDVYLRFLEPKAQAGREVLYAPEKYDGKMKAHEAGFLGLLTVELTPNSQLAMRGNRYPITDVGIEKLIAKLIEKGERDRLRGDCIVNRIPGETVGDRTCERIEVVHPTKQYDVDGKKGDHEFYKALIWFDTDELVPVKYASYLWPKKEDEEPLLEEEYTYSNLKFNVGLSDMDFDVDSKEYKFP